MPKKEIDAFDHNDEKRKNIPTDETKPFLDDEHEEQPEELVVERKECDLPLSERNKDLDPQLMWHGKDEENEEDLVAIAPPIYVQEKIEPRAIIEGLRNQKADANGDPTLFEDFNGLPFEQAVDFYEHDVNWSNRLILGDSLQVMASLAKKEGLSGQVKMIYMDPPYGIKFNSNWQVSTRTTQQTKTSKQPEQIKAFRDTWELGIHSYLSYLRDRLAVCRELLREDGSIFVQIGEENLHLVRSLLDEIFGRENFIRQIQYRTTMAQGTERITRVCDYILWFAKKEESLTTRALWKEKSIDQSSDYKYVELEDGTRREMTEAEINSGNTPKGSRRYNNRWPMQRVHRGNPIGKQPIQYHGKEYRLEPNMMWCVNYPVGMERLVYSNRMEEINGKLRFIRYLDEVLHTQIDNVWNDIMVGGPRDGKKKKYIVETNTKVIERCMLMATNPGDLILDPTCGGGTTAVAAEKWGRRWITIDTSRVAITIAKERLLSKLLKFYVLKDSLRGQELQQIPRDQQHSPSSQLSKGFILEVANRVGMRSIANNEEIVEGLEGKKLYNIIAKGSDKITLYDKPMIDKRKVRVTGRFTVETLSPFRIKSTDQISMAEKTVPTDYVDLIIGNMRKAGVQNTIRGERIKFDQLDSHAGKWVQATGSYTDSDGKPRSVAVSIGPEYGTVGQRHINEAAKEAKKGSGHDILLICAFAFEAQTDEHIKEFGNLKIMNVRINTDLMMGEALAESENANLFTVFGEPEIEVIKIDSDRWDEAFSVKLLGIDIYDPNTGEVRSSDPNDLACWFIDTEYNEEAFFVRHAYFTGGEENYAQLKRALRAEIDEEDWLKLYQTESMPFPRPDTNKIAVKVINHYGDEVMTVFDLNHHFPTTDSSGQ